MPSLYELAILAKITSFEDATMNLQLTELGWELLLTSDETPHEATAVTSNKQRRYIGAAFINHKQKQIVISHAGLKIERGFSNLLQKQFKSFKALPFESLAKNFSSKISEIKSRHSEISGYKLIHVGCYLGGLLAHLCGYLEYQTAVVSFDNPGCHENIFKLGGGIKTEKLDQHFTFLSSPNFINTINSHIGNVYQIKESDEMLLVPSSIQTTENIFFTENSMDLLIARILSMGSTEDFFQETINTSDLFQIVEAQGYIFDIKKEVPPGFSEDRAYYQASSFLFPKFKINQHTWLISHIAVGSICSGHSMLVVEGINIRRFNKKSRVFAALPDEPVSFIGYYHLIVPPSSHELALMRDDVIIEKNKLYVRIEGDKLQYVIRISNDRVIEGIIGKEELEKHLGEEIVNQLINDFALENLKPYVSKILEIIAQQGHTNIDENQQRFGEIKIEEFDWHKYKKYYHPSRTVSWICQSDKLKEMITYIKENEVKKKIPYNKFATITKTANIDENEITHNCTTWALEMLERAGIEEPGSKFNKIVSKPIKNIKSRHNESLQNQTNRCSIL